MRHPKHTHTVHVMLTIDLKQNPPSVSDVRITTGSPEQLTMIGFDYCHASLMKATGESFEQARDLAIETVKAAPHMKWAAAYLKEPEGA